MNRTELIRAVLTQALAPQQLHVEDDSHKHRGHAGAADGRGHFSVAIVAAAFVGKSPLARHRMVFDAMGGLMQSDVHALSIQARTPEEVTN